MANDTTIPPATVEQPSKRALALKKVLNTTLISLGISVTFGVIKLLGLKRSFTGFDIESYGFQSLIAGTGWLPILISVAMGILTIFVVKRKMSLTWLQSVFILLPVFAQLPYFFSISPTTFPIRFVDNDYVFSIVLSILVFIYSIDVALFMTLFIERTQARSKHLHIVLSIAIACICVLLAHIPVILGYGRTTDPMAATISEPLAFNAMEPTYVPSGYAIDVSTEGLAKNGTGGVSYFTASYYAKDTNTIRPTYSVNSFALPTSFNPPNDCGASSLPVEESDWRSKACEQLGENKNGNSIYFAEVADVASPGQKVYQAYMAKGKSLVVFVSKQSNPADFPKDEILKIMQSLDYVSADKLTDVAGGDN